MGWGVTHLALLQSLIKPERINILLFKTIRTATSLFPVILSKQEVTRRGRRRVSRITSLFEGWKRFTPIPIRRAQVAVFVTTGGSHVQTEACGLEIGQKATCFVLKFRIHNSWQNIGFDFSAFSFD